MTQNEFTQVTNDFIQQNPAHEEIKKSTKRGGPYSKNDKDARREEVRRLHFEYGYSARKIAELMNGNRNTVNEDIKFWYLHLAHEMGNDNFVSSMIKQIHSLELQKNRLREDLDNTKEFKQKLAIEKLLFQINSKLIHLFIKIRSSSEESLKITEVEVSEDEIKELVSGMVLKNKYSKDKTNVYSENEIKFELIRITKCDEPYAGIVFNKMLHMGLGLCGQGRTNQEYLDDNYSPKYDLGKFAIERNYVSTEKSSHRNGEAS